MGKASNNNRNSGGEKKKTSGCKMSRYYPQSGSNKGVEQTIVNGWKKQSNGDFLTLKAVTTGKSNLSEKGWYGSVAVTILSKMSMQKQFYWGTMEKATGKVVIQEIGWVMNPKGGKGGYVGTFSSK